MSDQPGAPQPEQLERAVRSALRDFGLEGIAREVDSAAAEAELGEGELRDPPRRREAHERAEQLVDVVARHLEDRATIAESTSRHLEELDLTRVVFVDPEGRERTEIRRGSAEPAVDREAARTLESIARQSFS